MYIPNVFAHVHAPSLPPSLPPFLPSTVLISPSNAISSDVFPPPVGPRMMVSFPLGMERARLRRTREGGGEGVAEGEEDGEGG